MNIIIPVIIWFFIITIPEQNWLHDIIQKPDRKNQRTLLPTKIINFEVLNIISLVLLPGECNQTSNGTEFAAKKH